MCLLHNTRNALPVSKIAWYLHIIGFPFAFGVFEAYYVTNPLFQEAHLELP